MCPLVPSNHERRVPKKGENYFPFHPGISQPFPSFQAEASFLVLAESQHFIPKTGGK